MTDGRKNRRPWSDEDVASMLQLREVERKMWSEIDTILKRPMGGSASKYETLRRERNPGGKQFEAGSRIDVSSEQIATRDARKEAENRMSVTAAVLGDPPPGFSALDRMRQSR